MVKKLFLIVACLVLSACAPKIVYLTRTEYKLTFIPSQNLEPVLLPAPPDQKLFLSKSKEDQRGLLANYSLKLQTTVEQCNARLLSIEELQNKQAEIIRVKNAEAAKEKP